MDARDHSHFVDFPVNLSTDVREPTGMSFAKRSSKKWPALNSMFPGVFFRVLQSKAMGVRRRPPKKTKVLCRVSLELFMFDQSKTRLVLDDETSKKVW